MNIAICTNLVAGLLVDAELLRGYLENRGDTVTLYQFDQPWITTGDHDLLIFLEVVVPEMRVLAKRIWLIANPEWLKPSYVRFIQQHVDRIFAKTREGVVALQARFPKVDYCGFLAQDRWDNSIERLPIFLHVGGKSGFKNTNAVIAAWREWRWWGGIEAANAKLIVISNSITVSFEPTPGITFYKQVSDEELKQLQNSSLYHLCPSAYEGYGQALHEAQSCGAIILSTAAPPMDEFGSPFSVPSIRQKKYNLGMLQEVSGRDIREAVPRMLGLPNHVIARMRTEARARWEKGNREFKGLFGHFLDKEEGRSAIIHSKPTIALLGNFRPEHSTENDLAWTLEDMGHKVLRWQEDEDTTEEILEGSKGCGLLLFVHTHGWPNPGKMSLVELWRKLEAAGTKTASFHLDRYVGLNVNDQREDRIGQHGFWNTGYVFTADGGAESTGVFYSRRINHYWLPPGIAKKNCYFGQLQKELSVDIGFVGARSYHPEYPFRGELISFLEDTYGERFKLFQGYRGEALNDLYSSISIIVGDSCFGGADYYWSDRVPESCGRGAFLIHPQCKGLNIPGLVTFSPGDLAELQGKIDWWLGRGELRDSMRLAAATWVKEHETYHNRMARVLKITGIL